MFITIWIHSWWIRPDTTLCNSRHDKQAWMSRHIRAQTTPTHASRFHLFTVAMTGHAEDRGFNYRSKLQRNRVVLMQQKRAGAREWDHVGMNKGVCLPGRSTGGTAPLIGTLEHFPEQDLSRRNGVGNQTQAYATLWCMNMAWVCDVVWVNAASIYLVEVHLNQGFKYNSKLSS